MFYSSIFTIEGDPIPQKRHRDFAKFNRVIKFDPCHKQKQDFAKKVLTHRPKMYKEPIEVELTFASSIKPSISPQVRNERLWTILNDSHVDLDNLAKFTLDACNGILWEDDCIITSLKCCKIYAEKPFTKICIIEKNKCKFEGNMSIFRQISPTEYQDLIDDCQTLSKFTLEDPCYFLEGCEQQQQPSAADGLINFVSKHFKLFQKLHKEITKLSKENQHG